MPAYRAYGLTIDSTLELPMLERSDGGEAQVTIRPAALPHSLAEAKQYANWQARPGVLLAAFEDTGRIMITGGCRIEYDCPSGTDPALIISIVLGTGLATILMQRSLLPIHSSCVRLDGTALLVMGRSGVGKSTLLGGLRKQGLVMLADDVTALDLDPQGRAIALPSFPASRLWEDSLTRLKLTPDGLAQVRGDIRKYYLPVESYHNAPAPLGTIVHLSVHNREDATITEVPKTDRVELLSRFIFRKRYIDGMDLRRETFAKVAKIADQVPMLQCKRPDRGIDPARLASLLLDHINARAGASVP